MGVDGFQKNFIYKNSWRAAVCGALQIYLSDKANQRE